MLPSRAFVFLAVKYSTMRTSLSLKKTRRPPPKQPLNTIPPLPVVQIAPISTQPNPTRPLKDSHAKVAVTVIVRLRPALLLAVVIAPLRLCLLPPPGLQRLKRHFRRPALLLLLRPTPRRRPPPPTALRRALPFPPTFGGAGGRRRLFGRLLLADRLLFLLARVRVAVPTACVFLGVGAWL